LQSDGFVKTIKLNDYVNLSTGKDQENTPLLAPFKDEVLMIKKI